MIARRKVVTLLLAALLPLVGAEGTPAGTVITNQATVEFIRSGNPHETVSNPVETVINPICSLSVTPNGTLGAPAHIVTSNSGEIHYLAYTLTNTGNQANDFLLDTLLDPSSSLTPDALELIWDQDLSGAPDPGEPTITSLSDLPADASVQLLLAVTVAETLAAGEMFVNLTARCADDPAVSDEDNVSQVIVPLGGFGAPLKSAEPAEEIPLYPDALVSYAITFTVNDRDLNDVVVSDELSGLLAEPSPSGFSKGLITDPDSGLSAEAVAAYDAASHTLTWSFASIPAGMTVRLELVTTVRDDLVDIPEGATIDNLAVVESETVPATPTEPVSHPLRPIIILLDKVASADEVRIGDDLDYTLTVSNPPASVDIDTLTLTDDLPPEVRYQPGSSRVTHANGSIEALEPAIDGRTLTWSLPGLAIGEGTEVAFTVTVLPEALGSDEIVNSAVVEASDGGGRRVADATAAAAATVDPEVFEGAPVLLGTVFIDLDLDGRFDRDRDEPLEGVRLYLSDGSSTVSDAAGRYAFLNLQPALVALRVDTTTAPNRFFERTRSEEHGGLWRIRLKSGVITRQDVPFEPYRAGLEVAQTLTVLMGPVTVTKVVVIEGEQLLLQLTVHSSEALPELTLDDTLPAGASAEDHLFALGDVPAGFETVIRYPVNYDGVPAALLLAPEIRWRLR